MPAIVFAAGGGEDHGPPAKLLKFLFNFGLLVAILVYYTKDSVRELFKNRYDEFNKKAIEAAKVKDELEAQKKDLNERLVKLRQNRDESLKKAKTDSEDMYTRELAQAKANAEKTVKDADGQVDGDFRKLIEKLRLETLELSVASAEEEFKSIDDGKKKQFNDEFKTCAIPCSSDIPLMAST